MNFTIYSLGDAAFLYAVLNAVSSVPESVYMQLGGIGAIIGLLIMGVKGVNEGNLMKAGFQGLIVSLVIFWVMFIARVDQVVVRDMAPSPTAPPMYVVDNVPAGFAAVGSTTSAVGVYIARLFDQAFGDVDENRVMTGGIGDNLRRITMLRHMADPVFVEASNVTSLSLFRHNIAQYMANCAMTGLTTGELSNRTLSVNTDANGDQVVNALDGMHFPHRALETKVRQEDGEQSVVSCAGAPAALLAASNFNPAASEDRGDPGMGLAFDAAMNGRSTFVSTIDTMQRFGMNNAAQWTQSAMINQVVAAATMQSLRAGGNTQSGALGAMMVEEAAARRNVQFAGEQNMFLRTMRTTIGFFEAVFYALGPIMAILVMTGPLGLTIASKYIMLTVWVLLWYPMLAIINLYGNVKMQTLVTQLAANPDYATSPIGTHQIMVIAQDQLGTVAGLVAATPFLAMSLMYGGAVAMNAVASRLAGGDQINEGKVTPQAMETAPALQAGPLSTSSVGGGMGIKGAAQPNIAVGEKLEQGMDFQRDAAVQASNAFTRAINDVFSEDSAYAKAWGVDRQNAQYAAADSGMDSALRFAKTENLGLSDAASYRESLSEEERRTFDLAAGAGIGKGLSGKVGWSSAEIEAFSKVGEEGRQVIEQISRQGDDSFGMKAAYMEGVKDSVTTSLTERGETKLANSVSESLGATVSEVASVADKLTLGAGQSSAIATDQKMELGNFVTNWRTSSGSDTAFREDVSRTVANLPVDLRDDYESILKAQNEGRNGFVGSPVENQAAAAALALTRSTDVSDRDHMNQMLDVVQKGSGIGTGSVGTFDADAVRGRVEGATKDVSIGNPALDGARNLEGPQGNRALVDNLVGGGFDNAQSVVPSADFKPGGTLAGGRDAATRALGNFGVTPETAASGNFDAIRNEGFANLAARSENARGGMGLIQDIEFGKVEEKVRSEYGEAATPQSGWAYNELSNHMEKHAAIAVNPSTPQVERDAALLEVAKAEASRSYLPTGSAGYGDRMKDEGLYVAGDRDASAGNFWNWRSENPAEAQQFRAQAMHAEKNLYGDDPSARMPYTQEIGGRVLGMMSR